MKSAAPFGDPAVKAVFDAYPAAVRGPLLKLRHLILSTAKDTPGVGEMIETLKWGQPAYLPTRPRTGTTVRIDALKGRGARYAALFHCQTTLIATFRERYGDAFSFDGNRAMVFSAGAPIPERAFRHCIALALTYHAGAKRSGRLV
jgi:Domain of unknown function (DU1801)